MIREIQVVESSEDAYQWEMRTLGKIWKEREQEAASQFTKNCEGLGRKNAAEIIAAEKGFTDRDAEVFVLGFCGYSAKFVNPRAEGREPAFRAGRAAWGSKEGQRLWRIKSVEARSTKTPVEPRPFNPGCGPITNSEYYE